MDHRFAMFNVSINNVWFDCVTWWFIYECGTFSKSVYIGKVGYDVGIL